MNENAADELPYSIQNGLDFRHEIWELVRSVDVHGEKSRLGLAFLSVALQHQHSIVLLIQQGTNDSSASALIRCLLDTSRRGLWALHHATNEQIRQIITDDFNFADVNIGKVLSEKNNLTVEENVRSFLHGLTHWL